MVTGKRPWAHLDNEWAILYNIGLSHQHPQLPEIRKEAENHGEASLKPEMSEVGVKFVRKCFEKAPQRPTATDLLNDEFFNPLKERLEEAQKNSLLSGSSYLNPWIGMGGLLSNINSPSLTSTSTIGRLNSYFGGTVSTVNQSLSAHLPTPNI